MTRRIVILTAVVYLIVGTTRLGYAQQNAGGQGSNSGGISGFEGASSPNTTLSGGSMLTGDERFVRDNREVGQLVGGTGEGVGNLRGQEATNNRQTGRQTSRNTAFGGLGGSNPFNQMFNALGRNSLQNQRSRLRIPVQLGFVPVNAPASPQVATRVQQRLMTVTQLNATSPLLVEMEGRVAVLRGAVGSEHDRNLAARLVMLEPGVSNVRNELQVASADPFP